MADQKPKSVNSELDRIVLRIDPEFAEDPAELWFELVLRNNGWGYFYIGVDSGSRPVTPALRISSSDVYDPFEKIASLAERAFLGELPFAFEIDSEGLESRLSLRPAISEGLAIFEVHYLYAPIILFVAEVNRMQFAIALAYAMQVVIRNPDFQEIWRDWGVFGPPRGPEDVLPHAEYFGNAWLRNLVIDPHPHKKMYYEGIDMHNYTRFHKGE